MQRRGIGGKAGRREGAARKILQRDREVLNTALPLSRPNYVGHPHQAVTRRNLPDL